MEEKYFTYQFSYTPLDNEGEDDERFHELTKLITQIKELGFYAKCID